MAWRVCSARQSMLMCYKLYWCWTVQMLITHDRPAVLEQIFVENHDFFVPHLHSMPALISIIFSRHRHAVSDGEVALEKGGGYKYSRV